VAEVERIVGQSRARWLRVAIRLRADSGFARDELMAWCEAIGVDDIFGLARDAVWSARSPKISPPPRPRAFAATTCGTIPLKLLKIGAQVRVSVRRIKVAMASACPFQTEDHLAYLYLNRAAFCAHLHAVQRPRRGAAGVRLPAWTAFW
jgi:Transposase DDE domain group 1